MKPVRLAHPLLPGSPWTRLPVALGLVILLLVAGTAVPATSRDGAASLSVAIRPTMARAPSASPTAVAATGLAPGILSAPSWFNLTSLGGGLAPPASQMASSAYDAADNVTVLFGGCQNVICPSNETWLFASGRWVNATNPSDAPPARYEASMDYDPNMGGVLLFGGLGSSGAVLNDTWLYTAGRWTNLSWVGPAPPGRRAAAMAFDPEPEENGSVLFGGVLASAATTNDTWVWESWSGWVPLTPSIAPSPVEFASMAYDTADHYLLLRGGLVVPCGFIGCMVNETWELYAGEWWPVHPSGAAPADRLGAAMTYDGATHKIVLFGGLNGTLADVNDTWTYTGGSWTSVNSPRSPSARVWAALAPDSGPGAPILFGGSGPSVNQNDTWAFENSPIVLLTPSSGPWEVSAPVVVNLTATGGTPPYQALVAFGDGAVASVSGAGPLLSVAHTFETAGMYAISANLTDALGVPATATSPSMNVAAAPAVAIRASSSATDAGTQIQLSAVAGSSGTPPLRFAWSFGDGAQASGANVTHTFANPGSYVVSVNVTDAVGAAASASLAVNVNPAPTLQAEAAPASVNATYPVRLFANVTGGTAPFAYAWRFGDGNTSGSPDPVHAFAQPGTYTVNVWVNDSSGGSTHATVLVNVAGTTSISAGAPGWFWPAILALLALGVVGVAAILLLPRRPKAPGTPP